MNFAGDVVEQLPAPAAGAASSWRATASGASGASARSRERSARWPARCTRMGVGRGDVVMTLIGNRPEWVFAMVACFRIGAVVLPCTEQLRAKDLRLRLDVARPSLIVADERNRAELEAARPGLPRSLLVPDERLYRRRAGRRPSSWPATTRA